MAFVFFNIHARVRSPGEGIVALYATPNPFLLNKICLNQEFDLLCQFNLVFPKAAIPMQPYILYILYIVIVTVIVVVMEFYTTPLHP